MRSRKTEEHMQIVLNGIAKRDSGKMNFTVIFNELLSGTEVTKVQNEELGARKSHAGICAGGAR